jgi:hypothetical protein
VKPGTDPGHSRSGENTGGIESPAEEGMPAALRRLARLLDGCPIELAQSPDDASAIAWMWQAVEDLEATILGLSQSNLPFLPNEREVSVRASGQLAV